MKFVFIYTNDRAPEVAVVRGVTSISYSLVGDVRMANVHYSEDGVVGEKIFYFSDGQPALLWE